MKFLVVGASGFIGSHVLEVLKAANLPAEGTSSRGRYGLARFDLATDSLASILTPRFLDTPGRLVLILAGFITDMDRCLTEPAQTRHVNVTRLCSIAEEAAALDAKIVFLSTGHVYEGTRGRYSENDPVAPVNAYAEHKLEVETFLLQTIPSAFIARLDKVVGTRVTHRHLLREWLELARAGKPIVCAEGMEISPTSVEDVAQAFLTATKLDLCGIYNVAGPDAVLRSDYASRFCEVAGFPRHVETQPLTSFRFLDRRALRSSLNGERFVRASGMHFLTSDEILARFVENSSQGAPLTKE